MGRQNLVAKATRKFKVTTDIAYRAGLGAHELLTLRLEKDKPADTRPKIKSKFYFLDLNGITYKEIFY